MRKSFVSNYAILADTSDNVVAWMNHGIVEGLMNWPTLEHAASVFTDACEQALFNFFTDLTL